METVTVTERKGVQTIHLPKGIRLASPVVSVRQEGDRVVIEPVKSAGWPGAFFESIRISDPDFERPDQGKIPPVKDSEHRTP